MNNRIKNWTVAFATMGVLSMVGAARLIGAPGEFVMFRWDDGSEDDTELRVPETPITVELGP